MNGAPRSIRAGHYGTRTTSCRWLRAAANATCRISARFVSSVIAPQPRRCVNDCALRSLQNQSILTAEHLEPAPIQATGDCVGAPRLGGEGALQAATKPALFRIAGVLRNVHVATR